MSGIGASSTTESAVVLLDRGPVEPRPQLAPWASTIVDSRSVHHVHKAYVSHCREIVTLIQQQQVSFEVSPPMHNFVQEMVKFNQFSKAQVLNAGAGATEKTMFLHDRTLSHGTEVLTL